jgi:prolipoprotein diacylglyceryltransferase
MLPSGGMTVFGGAFAALLVSAIGCRRIGVPLLAWLDCVAPAFALGAICERVGALLAGGDFGRYVGAGDLGHALAISYPAGLAGLHPPRGHAAGPARRQRGWARRRCTRSRATRRRWRCSP